MKYEYQKECRLFFGETQDYKRFSGYTCLKIALDQYNFPMNLPNKWAAL